DAYPGLAEEISEQDATGIEDGIFDYSISRLRKISPFIIHGMVHGWEFTYTPSDRLRRVDEFFELSELSHPVAVASSIEYSEPWVKDGRVGVWVQFVRSEQLIREYKIWQSIVNPRISGTGYGKISDGFDGITTAAEDALKDAVRSYYRTKIKNKPKEISGRVLVMKEPVVGISSGRYKMQLDFFLETDKIISYTQF
ncbi:MAG: hypothetical protein IJR49_02475, partial [Treponema sp.]|nr:hypothetical protein [Treponema sp.]